MPTAKSAVSTQPSTHSPDTQPKAPDLAAPRRGRGFITVLMAALVGVSFVLPASFAFAPVVDAKAGPNGCSSWSSTSRPPQYIRVLRRAKGKVVRVPFQKYVVTVMGKEWPSYLPQAVVEAGAVAVKQYGWYHAMGRAKQTRGGACYDVVDGTGDQIYNPQKARVSGDHHRAADKTWNVRLLKNGRLFMTGYRRGNKVSCGRDKTKAGYKLYARSATQCARRGDNYLEILRRYYSPNLDIVNGRGGSSSAAQTRSQSRPQTSSRSVQTTSSSNTPNVTDDRSSRIRLSGSWWYTSARNAINGTLLRSSDPGATAKFRFTGRELELIGRRGPGRGTIDVFINGRRVSRVDMSAARKQPKSVMYSQTWRTSRTRVVKLVVVRTPNRSKVELDAIRVH